MKTLKIGLAPILVICALIIFPGCKAKKLPQKPQQPATAGTPPPATKPVAAPVAAQTPPPPAPAAPNYNFSNIQFEFDSAVLKTNAYPTLDQMAAAMRANTNIKFNLNGYASIEGTEQHNMQLSQDRANSVKTYLVNAGVNTAQITTQGFGTANPIGDNNTDDGRILNRRVEVHMAQ